MQENENEDLTRSNESTLNITPTEYQDIKNEKRAIYEYPLL